jgi:glycosyltransferase involved in cell wall biosynthesis
MPRHRELVTFETIYYSLLVRKNINFEKYDVIHGTLMPASLISLSISPPDVPIVVTSHGTSIGEVRSHKLEIPTDYLKKFFFHPTNVLMDATTITGVDRVIAISSIAEEELERWYPVSHEQIVRIPHGVDTERFSPNQHCHRSINDAKFSLLHVGRLVSRKHVDLALEALAEIERDDIELLLAGTGRHRERLENRAAELGIAEDVDFLGFVPEEDLPTLYASSDAFLFLSRYEGFGLTFLESMASGTPVIGTRVGGFPDMVTDGEEGIIVDHGTNDVANAIERLADDPELIAEMGRRVRAVAESRTWDDVAADTEAVYKAVLEEDG